MIYIIHFLMIALLYLAQMVISCFINICLPSRIPKDNFDFFRLTFLPHTLYWFIFNKNKLK